MICIARDRNSLGDLYRITSKEPGVGRGFAVGRATLDEAKEALDHYFLGPDHKGRGGVPLPGCALCDEVRLPVTRPHIRREGRPSRITVEVL